MERDLETRSDVIELGKASVETLGQNGGLGDDFIYQQPAGLSDD